MSDRESLAALLRERSMAFGSFRLASGRESRYYIDARKTTMSAEGQVLVGRLGLQTIREQGWNPAAVGGLTMGADPVAYAIARASADAPPLIHAFTVRKAAKDHGTGRLIEGNLHAGEAAVVVEDVLTSGNSAVSAIRAVREYGAEVIGVLVVVDREEGGGKRVEEEANVKVVAITTTTALGI
ncbi:MAG: orotate phosphoribosyltransferase [Gemmatimonadales bacterium]